MLHHPLLALALLALLCGCHGAPVAQGAPAAPAATANDPAAPAATAAPTETAAPTAEASVKPGINEQFLDPGLDVANFEQRFEVESREIFAQRARIAGQLSLRPGMAVADVGAGTGLFTFLFAPKVGPEGRVYAVEIAPKFVAHIEQQAAQRKLTNVQAVLCTERSVELPERSVDLVFVCDTYHHFEYPQSTLASIHRALRPGGELVIVDFIREPGVSRQWILDHVRAGRDQVTKEVEAAGFDLVQHHDTPFLQENYLTRFRRR